MAKISTRMSLKICLFSFTRVFRTSLWAAVCQLYICDITSVAPKKRKMAPASSCRLRGDVVLDLLASLLYVLQREQQTKSLMDWWHTAMCLLGLSVIVWSVSCASGANSKELPEASGRSWTVSGHRSNPNPFDRYSESPSVSTLHYCC